MTKLIKTLQGTKNDIPPLWLMRQAGRYLPEYQNLRKTLPSFMDLCFNEEAATKVTLQPIDRFDFDAAIFFNDILVIPHILGQKVQFLENLGPCLDPIHETSFFENAKNIDLMDHLKTPLKIIQNCRATLPSTKAVIGFAGSPWTIATYMLEQGKSEAFEKILSHLKHRTSLLTKTMALLEEAVGTYLVAQIQAGADCVQIFDSWAKAVPPNDQQEWIVAPTRRLIQHIHQVYPQTPIIYYGRGVSYLYPAIAQGLKNIAFSVDEMVSPSAMKQNIQSLAPVQGNLCPKILVEGGERLRNGIKFLLETFQDTPFVFNLGHGILPQTPISHVESLVDMVRGRQ